jgi:hypothetical protein
MCKIIVKVQYFPNIEYDIKILLSFVTRQFSANRIAVLQKCNPRPDYLNQPFMSRDFRPQDRYSHLPTFIESLRLTLQFHYDFLSPSNEY